MAFHSDATSLVAGDTNNVSDVFIRDRSVGVFLDQPGYAMTLRASLATNGAQANAASYPLHDLAFALTQDGFVVAFDTAASNLVNADTNAVSDLFVRVAFTPPQSAVQPDPEAAPASHWPERSLCLARQTNWTRCGTCAIYSPRARKACA